jgi:hypothetical protein
MCVSTENKVHAGTRCPAQDNWVMGQQQLHFVIGRACQRQLKIFQPDHCVVDPGQPERSFLLLKTHTLVNQNSYAFGAEKIRYERCVCPVIVITQDGKDAVSSFEVS